MKYDCGTFVINKLVHKLNVVGFLKSAVIWCAVSCCIIVYMCRLIHYVNDAVDVLECGESAEHEYHNMCPCHTKI